MKTINIDKVSHALQMVERLSALMTPQQEFDSRKGPSGTIYDDGVTYDDVDEMVSDMSDDRLCEEYALFVEFITEAQEIMKS